MNILITDDVPMNLKLLRAELESGGHTVFDAPNGAEAWKILEQEKVEAIISDILMPVMDGYRLCYEVRKDERFKLLPFIFYTATYVSAPDEKLACALGGDKFLRKPSPGRVLIDTLAEVSTEPRYKKPRLLDTPEGIVVIKEYSERLVAKLEQKNAELAQRNAQLLLQGAALETTANGVVITSPKGIIQWVNPAFSVLTGYTADEAIGRNPRILKSGKHSRGFYKEMWETILAGNTWRGSFINKRKDGTLYYDEHTITPVKSTAGEVEHFVTIMHDVTEQRRAERELRFQKLLLEAQSEASIDGILTVDANAKIISFNRRFIEMWSLSEELLASRTDGPVLQTVIDHIVEPDQFLERVRYLYEHPDLVSHEEIALKDGRVFDRHTSPVKGVDGIYYGRIWTFRDITERKQAEEALRLSEARYRTLFECSPDGIMIADPGNHCVDANPEICRMLGYSHEEMIGRHASTLIDPAEVAQLKEINQRSSAYQREWQLRRKDGSLIWVEVTSIGLPNGNRLGIIRDITGRKHAEEALRESDERLRTVTETAHVGLVMVDAQHCYRFANRAYCIMLNLPTEDIVGQRIADVLPQVYETQIRPRLERAFKGERVEYELEFPAPAEAVGLRHYSVTYQPGMDRSHPVVVVVIMDITASKRAAAELLAQLDELRRWHEATLGREERVLELKTEVNSLLAQLKRPPAYTTT